MNWPLASDYQDAIQNPAFCFQDAALKAAHPVVTKLGLPRVASGTFASVYEMRNGAHRWAVRCFLRPSADQQNRYALLSQYLSSHHMPGIVDFAYEAQGIRIRGQWYPIVKMEWIDGMTLHTYIGQHVSEAATVRKLAEQWADLMETLRLHAIAHADLQHGNVLVTPGGALRLVDYDGMFVPTLHGQPSHELGHTNYQHPQRAATDYDANLDNFSALVIYTSLVALTYDHTLWTQFHTGENLIFSTSDFKAPQKSAVFERLYRSPESLVRKLSQRLALACEGPVWRVPKFFEVVAEFPDIPEPTPWWLNNPSFDAPPKPHPAPALSDTASAAQSAPSGRKTPPPAPVAAEEETTLPEWMQREKMSQSPAQAHKLVAGLLLPLARLWQEASALKSTTRPSTAQPTPVSPAAPAPVRTVTQPVSLASVAQQPTARKEKRSSRWLTFTSVSCLVVSITLYGIVMLGSFIFHKIANFIEDVPPAREKINTIENKTQATGATKSPAASAPATKTSAKAAGPPVRDSSN